jgi:hypothetical protein
MPFLHILPDLGMNYTFNRPLLENNKSGRPLWPRSSWTGFSNDHQAATAPSQAAIFSCMIRARARGLRSHVTSRLLRAGRLYRYVDGRRAFLFLLPSARGL